MATALSWIEVDTTAISDNLRQFAQRLAGGVRLLAVVKGNGYGHGMLPVARAALEAGAHWLGVFHLGEVEQLRAAGITVPILILGYVPASDMELALRLEARITTSSLETISTAGRAAARLQVPARLHLKVECGTHRLGVTEEQLPQVLQLLRDHPGVQLEGVHTHFANIEDTTEHDYARGQLQRFRGYLELLHRAGLEVALPHTACTAAAILFPDTHFAMVRVGIGLYGMWPSKETQLSALQAGRSQPNLRPALCWKTRVVQVKDIPAGAYVGYGCSHRTTRPTRLAVLPVGYANGYDRLLSNRGHVLVAGTRAPILGRVCMNLTMVDVTDIPGVSLEQEVVLLGRQGEEVISAEQMAGWAQTINYEVVTRADPHAPRLVVNRRNTGEPA
ncbi:MAG: alanine racemase [Deltaproteobacteria bacterium]|nr:MAG: alanine racemase [Deltaproteobacteria bacterium]